MASRTNRSSRRWFALALLAAFVVLREFLPEFWQDVLWWIAAGLAVCSIAYLVWLLRQGGTTDEHKPVEKPE